MFAVWGVEPCYLACAFASFILVGGGVVGLSRCVGEVVFVAGLVKCLLVCWFGVVEDVLGYSSSRCWRGGPLVLTGGSSLYMMIGGWLDSVCTYRCT